jgi:virginiamycin A acetyltransferase
MPHDPRLGPDPDALHPMPRHPRVTFIRNLPLPPNVEVGAYTYYDDPEGPDSFLRHVLYHFEFSGDHLRIGRFCALAAGTTFLMNGGNHRLSAPSTYPFQIFGGAWAGRFEGELDFPNRGDTVVGNDVWTGWRSTFMPGVKVGDGAVVAARSVVTRDVPPYAIVAGNPASVVRMRYDPATVETLLRIRWWDWDVERITRNLEAISGRDAAALAAAAGTP